MVTLLAAATIVALLAWLFVYEPTSGMRSLSMRELLITMYDPEAEADEAVRSAATEAVMARPEHQRVWQLAQLVVDAELDVRRGVATVLGWGATWGRDPAVDERRRQALLTLIEDVHEEVQAAAVVALVATQIAEFSPEVMLRLEGVIRSLLASKEAACRRSAASAVAWIGEQGAELGEDLLAMDTSGDAGRIAFEQAQALGRIRLRDVRAVKRLTKLLDDPEWDLRLVAVQSLGRIGRSAVSSVPRLFAMMEGNHEKDIVRACARTALARIARDPADVERALQFVLENRAFADFDSPTWLVDLGRLAMRVPQTKSATQALQLLAAPDVVASEALVVPSIAVRILLHRDEEQALASAISELLYICDDLESDIDDGLWVDETDQPLAEALIDVCLAYPDKVDVEELRSLLTKLVDVANDRWEREWAEEQLARLPC